MIGKLKSNPAKNNNLIYIVNGVVYMVWGGGVKEIPILQIILQPRWKSTKTLNFKKGVKGIVDVNSREHPFI